MGFTAYKLRDELRGSYNPLLFMVRLESEHVKVRPEIKDAFELEMSEAGVVTLWHEYVHFMQAVSTISGIGELLNWFDVQADLAKDAGPVLAGKNPQDKAECPNLSDSVGQRGGYLPQQYYREDRDLRFSPPAAQANYEGYCEGEIAGIPSFWIKFPVGSESKAIRVTRDFFAEGMARAVGELVSKSESPSEEAALSDSQIIYYALRFYLKYHLPEVDSLKATILIADACLLTEQPFLTFKNIDKILRCGKSEVLTQAINEANSVRIASLFNLKFDDEIRTIKKYLCARKNASQGASIGSPAYNISLLWGFLDTALDSRLISARPLDYIFSNKKYSWDTFKVACAQYGSPLILVGNSVGYLGQPELKSAWITFAGGTELIRRIVLKETSPCLFQSLECCLHEGKISACDTEFLHVSSDSKGNTCLIAAIVEAMSLNQSIKI